MSILGFIWWAIIFYLFIYMPISHVMNKKAKRKEEKGEKKYILVEESKYNSIVESENSSSSDLNQIILAQSGILTPESHKYFAYYKD